MNRYEIILIGGFCLFVIGLIVLNVFKLGKYCPPIFLCTDTIYMRIYGKYRLFIDEAFKDKIVFLTNCLSVIFMTIGTIMLVVELFKRFTDWRKSRLK